MTVKEYSDHIGDLIAENDLKTAIQQLHQLLKNSPKLDEAIIQSARYNDLMEQIRLGTVNFEDANITKNKIRSGILNLLDEIEEQAQENEQILSEIERHNSSSGTIIQNSRNIVSESNLDAAGNIIIGDNNITS